MGKLQFPEKMPEVDFYGTPEYFVTKTWTEPAGAGCVRLFAVCERNGQFFPLYTAVMEAPSAMIASRDAGNTAETVFGLQQLLDHRKDH